MTFISATAFADGGKKDPYARLDAFAQILNVVESNYVDTIDRNKVIDGAIDGMIRALDPHSSFMTASQRRDFELRTGGSFVGIGVEVGVLNNELRVITALNGGPAEKAGLQSGDTILAVDGEDVSKLSLDALSMKLQGDIGSTVKLIIRRPEVLAPKQIIITRDIVKTEITFSKLLDPHYGYVKLKSFGPGAAAKVREEIDSLIKMTRDNFHGLVLDLRQNPGGYINEATDLASLFLSNSTIVETRGRDGVVIQKYTSGATRRYDFPVAVLIDAGSASASEIVSGALQDNHRAIIVGTQSFGKASVQNIFTLKDGSSLKLTIGRYYTPSGKSIQALGITPDIYVERRISYEIESTPTREKDLPNALPAGAQADQTTKYVNPTDDDIQLFTAYSILLGHERMTSGR